MRFWIYFNIGSQSNNISTRLCQSRAGEQEEKILKKVFALVLSLLLMAVLAAGCNNNPASTPVPTEAPTPEAVTTPEVQATPEILATPEITPEITPETTLEATPEVSPEISPEAT